MFYRTGVIADGHFTLQEYGFWMFLAPVTLDLEAMIFIYELDLKMYRMCENELCQGVQKLSSQTYRDRRTDRLTDTIKIIYHTALRVVKNAKFCQHHMYESRSMHS